MVRKAVYQEAILGKYLNLLSTIKREQPLVGFMTGETPYNVRGTPKASDTKPNVETRPVAELIALGMVKIQRIMSFS